MERSFLLRWRSVVFLIFLAFFVFFWPCISGYARQIRLSFEKIPEVVGEQNLSLSAMRKRLASARTDVYRAGSVFLPSISVGAFYERSHNYPMKSFSDNDGYYIEVSQLLFSAKDFVGYKQAKIAYASKEASYDSLFQELVFRARRLLLNAVVTRKYINAIKVNLALAREYQAVVMERFAKGQASEYDKLRAEEEVQLLSYRLTKATAMLTDLLNNLKVVLGVDKEDTLVISDSLDYVGYNLDLDTLKRLLYTNSPHLRGKRLYKALAGMEKKKAAFSFWPKIFLSFRDEADKLMPFATSRQEYDHYSVFRVNISLPIFEGGRRFADLHKAEVELAAREDEYNEYRRQLESDLVSAYTDCLAYAREVRASKKGLERAKRLYDIVFDRYKSGLASYIDLLDARAVRFNAEVNYLSSLQDYYGALFRIERIIGMDVKQGE